MNFSVYNLYNRANPYFIYFDVEGDGNLTDGGLEPKAFQISIFPIIPSVAWNFNFLIQNEKVNLLHITPNYAKQLREVF